ncbi:hypothetical protein JAAARDRAFT_195444 [Jaapia argillacea MUCL 33604]|uniref:F-box domain-containing protein n=1 Tax=Jaapia argillacea MUCL 33604 TaxID=933084 RepID=A0A067PWF2_9AGAM|nr:hypothetical protein JAAARDRAFT_195444 [Jaapia argillacea MUCL 33604]
MAENWQFTEPVDVAQGVKSDSLAIPSISTRAAFRLPPELLRGIFLLALPPNCVTRPVLDSVSASWWPIASRGKQTLALVCKTWMAVGTEILYEHIAIRRPTQLPLLVRTMQLQNADFGRLVKTFTLCCFIPYSWRTMFAKNLAILFSRYSHIQRLIISPLWEIPSPDTLSQILCASTINLASITHLEASADVVPGILDSVLERCTNLRSLVLAVPTGEMTPHRVHLPRLDTLRLSFLYYQKDGKLTSLMHWSMPRLTSLTICDYGGVTDAVLKEFLKSHGKHLQFLQFPDVTCPRPNIDSGPLISECPKLEHFVMPMVGIWPTRHRSLMWFDVWAPCTSDFSLRNDGPVQSIERTPSFPAFKNFRLLDCSLLCVRDLPRIFPPDGLEDEDSVEYDLVGLTVIQTRHSLRRDEVDLGSHYGGSSASSRSSGRYALPASDVHSSPGSTDGSDSDGELWEDDVLPFDEVDGELDEETVLQLREEIIQAEMRMINVTRGRLDGGRFFEYELRC